MTKHTKSTKFLLLLLTSTLLLLVLSHHAFAQEQTAEVIIASSAGGTTTPGPGTYTYNYGDTIRLTAIPNAGFEFKFWIIIGNYSLGHNVPAITYPEGVDPTTEQYVPSFGSPSLRPIDSLVTSTNPLNVICGYGYTYTYEPIFTPVGAPSPGANAVAIILAAAGGTTNPNPGTYTYLANQTISLTATPDEGYQFQYWVAKSTTPGHDAVLLDKTVTITLQAGDVNSYQPVFAPTAATTPSGGIPTEALYAAIAILVIIAVIGIGMALMYRGKSKPSPT